MKELIIKRIRNHECTHIKTSKGLGATTILKSLPGIYAEPSPLKPIIKALSNKEKGSIAELKKEINYNQTLLIDDVQFITKQVKRFIKKAINQGLIIVTAGEKNVFNLHELELKPLSYNESVKLVNKHLKNKDLSKVIVSEVGGNPALLMQAVRKAKARDDLMTVKGFKEFKQSINNSVKRIDLLNVKAISIIASLMISLKYLFYTQHQYTNGYLIATIAYGLIAINKFNKK